MIQLGTCTFDPELKLLRDRTGARVMLRPQAAQVLECLAQAQGAMVIKDDLVKAVWGNIAVTDDSLVQCISEIRAAIEDTQHEVLMTERRRGYRLALPCALANTSADRAEPSPVHLEPVEGLRQTLPEQVGLSAASPTADGQAYPAIAVMPFTSLKGDARSERDAQNFAAAIIAEMARYKDVHMISRQTAFAMNSQALGSKEICEKLNARFVVTGQVQLNGSGIQWSLELVDGHSEEIVWTHRNPPGASPALTNVDSLAQQLTGSIVGSYKLFTWQQNIAKPLETLSAYDLTAKGYAQLFLGSSAATTRLAHQIASYAVQKFPTYARAWRLQGHARSFDINCAHTGEWTEKRVGEALAGIRKALELEPDNPNSLMVLADLLLSDGQLQEAIRASDRSMALAPADPHVCSMRAILMFHAGQLAEASRMVDLYLAAFPLPPSFFYASYGRILMAMGEDAKALEVLQRVVALTPGSYGRATLVLALHEQGETQQAAEHFRLLLEHTSGFDESHFGNRWKAIPALRDRFINAMRAYGLKPSGSTRIAPLSLVKKS